VVSGPAGPYDVCLVHLDDLTVVVRTFQEQQVNLQVFQVFRGTHLELNAKECKLFQKDVRYLGHRTAGRSDYGPEKLEAVEEWPRRKERTRVEELPWCVHLLTEIHWRIGGHRKATDPVHGRRADFTVVSRSRSCLQVPEVIVYGIRPRIRHPH
jgi:hypothetical protein